MLHFFAGLIIFSALQFGCGMKTVHQINTDKTASEALEYYRANQDSVRDCYQPILQANPNLIGKITLTWTVNDRGEIVNPTFTKKTIDSPEIEACIMNHLRSLNFKPAPAYSEAMVTVSYTFND